MASIGADLDEENDVTQLKRRIRMLEQLHQERSLSEVCLRADLVCSLHHAGVVAPGVKPKQVV